MVISWYGEGSFRLSGEDGVLWTDVVAFGDPIPRDLDAHVVTLSDGPHVFGAVDHSAPAPRAAVGDPFVVRGPGEYEVHGVFVTAVTVPGRDVASRSPDVLAVNVLLDGVAVCHLPWFGSAPDKEQIEMLGDIDVLLVSIGGVAPADSAAAADLVGSLEPSIVVPMHYDPTEDAHIQRLERFLAELGLEPMEPLPRLQIERTQLPEDLQAVVLATSRRPS